MRITKINENSSSKDQLFFLSEYFDILCRIIHLRNYEMEREQRKSNRNQIITKQNHFKLHFDHFFMILI